MRFIARYRFSSRSYHSYRMFFTQPAPAASRRALARSFFSSPPAGVVLSCPVARQPLARSPFVPPFFRCLPSFSRSFQPSPSPALFLPPPLLLPSILQALPCLYPRRYHLLPPTRSLAGFILVILYHPLSRRACVTSDLTLSLLSVLFFPFLPSFLPSRHPPIHSARHSAPSLSAARGVRNSFLTTE